MSKSGHFLNKQPKKKGKKIALTVLAVLLVVVIGAVAAGLLYFDSIMEKIKYVTVETKDVEMNEEIENLMGIHEETEPVPPSTEVVTEPTTEATTVPTEPKEPDILNVLVTGQSFREGETSRLADTLILVTINKDSKEVTLTSFPRDTWVDLPDYKHHTCGWNLINTNYALGYNFGGTAAAMTMINNCLKINFGIEVDYDIEISLDAFPAIIDALGGVRMELTQAEADYINGLGYDWVQVVAEGENRLFGEAALEYARMRKAEGDSDSDIVRTERQRKMLTALFGKLRSKSLKELRDIAYEILPMIKTNMTNEQITECLFDVLPLLADMTISSGTCPVSGTAWPEDKDIPGGYRRSVMVFSSEQQKRLMMPITEGYAP